MNPVALGAFVALSLFAAMGVVGLVLLVRHHSDTIEALGAELAALRDEIDRLGPLMADTRSALRHAERRSARADDLVIAATAVTERADAASALAYRVAANPIVRLMAALRGVKRGIGALVRR